MTALLEFDPPTALRFVGFVYALMAATVWVLLDQRHEHEGLAYWCLGGAALAAGALLYGLREIVSDWLSVQLANLLIYASYALRVVSLRLEMQAAPRRGLTLLLFGVVAVVFLWSDWYSGSLRVQVGTGIQVMGAAWLACSGMQVARTTGLRGARWIGGAYSALTLAMFVLFVSLVRLDNAPPVNVNNQLGLLVVLLAGTAAALYGHFGYVGMTLERLRSQDLLQATALAHEAALRSAAEHNAAQLQDLLNEREEMLSLLAHEVRQPLNNASAALQSARTALVPAADGRTAAPAVVEQRVQRAQRVLSQIIGTLDNTLAATALLASPERVGRQDADIDVLVGLSLGDLDPTKRARVEVERLSPTRTAMMDSGLLRLALRNLLSNALAFSPPDKAVLLRVRDSDEPLAVVFEVLDRGPGLDAQLHGRLFLRGERGQHGQPGHGLGLYVVQRVAQLHGGEVTVQAREGGGSVFSLILPQDQAD